ncbi:MAG: thioredoxin-disulfide reductase [Lachnospiraceae bacterium]|nr:thioredoxin-disulfide reductase [Lachnospiraceae bacterium]
MRDVIIIGSGPAGMGAAIYGKRAGLDTLIIEKTGFSGGQITNTYEVDNYLGLPGVDGYEMAMNFRSHVDKLGADFEEGEVHRVRREADTLYVETASGSYETKTVIIASGASHSKLGIPGEEELSGMGVSYCATCDGAFFRGKTTAVVGGGDVAVEDAIFLARSCEKVYLIHRRDQLRAAKILQESLLQLPNVEVIWDSVAEEITGEGKVEALRIKNVKTGETRSLPLQGVFIAVGIKPSTVPFRGLVDMDEKGYIMAGEDCCTSEPGIFVAGDCRRKELRQIITAVADGANAVNSIQRYLVEAGL